MSIIGSYERHPDLGCEAIVFLDDETGACFQIQRDLVGGPRADEYCVTTGASAPVYGAVKQWRRVDGNRFEFELVPRAGRLFGDDVLSFEVTSSDATPEELAVHLDRILR
ncbi:hypothetical protein [Gordonia sp. (in: high G+C Gram-positive bacteria)]|uniref:hypothetical protein n=1 Tax=Gordonia sp. (in: high G+C Gram-positive bacteria) TaxID=84139 RepID=UPI0039E3276F